MWSRSGGSAEAEDENVGGDVDDGAASTLILPVRNDCSKVFLSIATSIGTKVRCAIITCHQQTTVVLSQSLYRSEKVTQRLSTTHAPAKYLIECVLRYEEKDDDGEWPLTPPSASTKWTKIKD